MLLIIRETLYRPALAEFEWARRTQPHKSGQRDYSWLLSHRSSIGSQCSRRALRELFFHDCEVSASADSIINPTLSVNVAVERSLR